MTKKELMQLYYLNREIMYDMEELVNLKIENRGLKTGAWEKRREKMIKKREAELVTKIHSCTELRDRVKRFIDSIEDSLTRQVFYYRYSKCMTWRQVAYMIGGGNSDEGVRKIAERYLKKIEKK
ncbi:MAG: hypothetical protein IKW62_01640 [Clostridia bacterium]|nr:hypothetical protein [Clostridia bacterium]